jgi:hypothetical protein
MYFTYHASNPQVTLLLALLGERDWQDNENIEVVKRLEDLDSVSAEIYVRKRKKDIIKATGALWNRVLTESNIQPLSGEEASSLITFLKSLPKVEYTS